MNETVSASKKIATMRNPTIKAVVGGLFRFPTREEALIKREALQANFETSNKLPIVTSDNEVVMWIKGFALTPDDKEQGYLGHFAALVIEEIDGKWRIGASKHGVDLQFHPQKKRPKARHPDWGHPILKAIQKKRVYANVGLAEKELMRLHEEYPSTSIPTGPELFIMIYEKSSTPSVQKYALQITPHAEGGVVIAYERNMPEQQEKEAKQGTFAAKAAIEQSRKTSKSNYLKKKRDA